MINKNVISEISEMLNGKNHELTIEDLGDLPIFALEKYCLRKNISIIVSNGSIKGLCGGNGLFPQKRRHISSNNEV